MMLDDWYDRHDVDDWRDGPDEPPPAPPEELGRCLTTPGCTGMVWRDRELSHRMWCTGGCFDDAEADHLPDGPPERWEGGVILAGHEATEAELLRWAAANERRRRFLDAPAQADLTP